MFEYLNFLVFCVCIFRCLNVFRYKCPIFKNIESYADVKKKQKPPAPSVIPNSAKILKSTRQEDSLAILVRDFKIANVRRILKDLHLNVDGSDLTLRNRLLSYLRDETVSAAVTDNNLCIPVDNVTVCSPSLPIQDWGIRFNGSDPVSFLEDLIEKKTFYQASDKYVLTSLNVLFEEQVLLWWRNNRHFWNKFEEFVTDFRLVFFPPFYTEKLEEELVNRKQKVDENGLAFVTHMQTLARRLGNIDNSKLFNRIYRNLRPEYRLYLRRSEFSSIQSLVIKIKEFEDIVSEMAADAKTVFPFRSLHRRDVSVPRMCDCPKVVDFDPDKASKSSNLKIQEDPTVAVSVSDYPLQKSATIARSRSSECSSKVVDASAVSQNTADVSVQSSFYQPSSRIGMPDLTNRVRQQNQKRCFLPDRSRIDIHRRNLCWNCACVGHRRFDCRNKPVKFCSRCGCIGLRSIECCLRTADANPSQPCQNRFAPFANFKDTI